MPATHKLFSTCCPPTSTIVKHSPRINTNTNRHNRVHMVATLLRLTFILPDETCCLYLEHSAFNTNQTHCRNNANLSLRDNATWTFRKLVAISSPDLRVKPRPLDKKHPIQLLQAPAGRFSVLQYRTRKCD